MQPFFRHPAQRPAAILRHGIPTEEKINFRFPIDEPLSRHRQTKVRMPAQHRETRKNFIGIVSDPTEEERAVEAAARWQPHVMSYLVDRLTAALRRRTKGAWGPPSP